MIDGHDHDHKATEEIQGDQAVGARDRALLSGVFEDCFFTRPGMTRDPSRLREQLEDAHWASGFKPRVLPGLHNGLADPGEMMVRAFHLWQQTRWPGRNGRVHYARTHFNLYVIQCLALLGMRVWDDGSGSASTRLSQIQGILDRLWAANDTSQPVFVRDARWLIPLAQSPATDDLGPYFEVAERIGESFTGQDSIAIHRAGVLMAAGHLRSQTRHYALKHDVPLEDRALVQSTRCAGGRAGPHNGHSGNLRHALMIPLLVLPEFAVPPVRRPMTRVRPAGG